MQPSNVILDAIASLIAADTATLAPAANANHVHLAKAPFTPSPALAVADVTEADFDGSTPLDAGVGPQDEFTDPLTTLRIVQLLEPGGGWHWVVTGATNLPQTIYGWFVTDNTDAVMIGSGLFAQPLTLNAIGQGIDIPWLRFTFSNSSPN